MTLLYSLVDTPAPADARVVDALGFSVALEICGFPADIAKFTLLRELAVVACTS